MVRCLIVWATVHSVSVPARTVAGDATDGGERGDVTKERGGKGKPWGVRESDNFLPRFSRYFTVVTMK